MSYTSSAPLGALASSYLVLRAFDTNIARLDVSVKNAQLWQSRFLNEEHKKHETNRTSDCCSCWQNGYICTHKRNSGERSKENGIHTLSLTSLLQQTCCFYQHRMDRN
jgi:hypothetical protein